MNALVDDIIKIFPELNEVFKELDIDKQRSQVMNIFFSNYLGEFNVDIENIKKVQLGQRVFNDDDQMISKLNFLCAINSLIPNINLELFDLIFPSKETVISKVNYALKFYEFVDSLTTEIYDIINPHITARSEIRKICLQIDEIQDGVTNTVTLKIPHIEQLVETAKTECEAIGKKTEEIIVERRALQHQLQQTKSKIQISLRKKQQSENTLSSITEKLKVKKLTLDQSFNCDEQIKLLSDKLSSLNNEVIATVEKTELEIIGQGELIKLRDCLGERCETVKKMNETLSRLKFGAILEQESLIEPDDSHYCKQILKRVIKHDDPFKESKAKQLRRYINSTARIIHYVNYDIASDIFSKGDCWVDDNVYGKRLDRRFFVQELIDISSKNSYDNHPYESECYALACLNCLDEQLIRNLFTLYKKTAKEVHNLSEDDILEKRSRELEKFWGHFITNKLELVKEEFAEYYDTNIDIYGFKIAYHDCEREAVAFFYKRLEERNISEEVKLNLLVEAALYSMSGTNDVDTTIFCLQKVMGNEQNLEKFLKKCNVLYVLIREDYFDTVCQLFSVWSQFNSAYNYRTLLSIINWTSSKSRANLLDNIVELGKERFWKELPSLDCAYYGSLLKGFAENNCNKVFKELWQAYSNDQCRYVFSSGCGKDICIILFANGNRTLLKEFLFHYANSNEAVLKDIDSFISNIDIVLNSYVSTNDASLDKMNCEWVVHDEIVKTLPKLIEVLDHYTQNVQVQNTSIEVDSISPGQSSKEYIH